MKIFGKRKKTAASSASNKSPPAVTPQKTFASDAIVEDLLKKDPSEWNAKEKRMVKRYRERRAKEDGPTTAQQNIPGFTENIGENVQAEQEGETNKDNSSSSSSENKSESDSDSSNESENDESKNQDVTENKNEDISKKGEQSGKRKTHNTTPTLTTAENEDSKNIKESTTNKFGASGMVDYVDDLLEGLNSKQRRTITRRIEREGESCMEEVRAEVAKLKRQSTDDAVKTPNLKQEEKSTQNSSGKKRKRRRGQPADLSGLTPEERLRREEQRKRQKEVAEQRARGEDDPSNSKFRHPLNSERRRANRRKPKWAPKKSFAKIEHNASGYQARKFKK